MVYASWGAALLTGVVLGILLAGSGGRENGLLQLLHTDIGKTATVAGKPYELVLTRSYLGLAEHIAFTPIEADDTDSAAV